jgi:hypothetical protein
MARAISQQQGGIKEGRDRARMFEPKLEKTRMTR